MEGVKIPFGLRDGNVLHVTDVGKGLGCRCLCPKCMAPLVAVKGAVRQHHFRHHLEKEACEGAFESAIHLAAKKVISDRLMLLLPEHVEVVEACGDQGDTYSESETAVKPSTPVHFDRVELEVTMGDIRPDAVGYCSGTSLAIEITYSHPVTTEKARAFAELHQSAVEINLSHVGMADVENWEVFASHIYNPTNLRWIHNEKSAQRVRPRLEARVSTIIQSEREKHERKQAAQRAKVDWLVKQYKRASSAENVKAFADTATRHFAWVVAQRYLPLTWDALPPYMGIPVQNGDWIYGCDQRVWQAALFGYFISRRGIDSMFTTQRVDEWLTKTAGCRTPDFVKKLLYFSNHEAKFIPADVHISSSWQTVRAYCEQLEKMGIITYLGPHRDAPGSSWYKVLKTIPLHYR